MRRLRIISVSAASVLVLCTSACGRDDGRQVSTPAQNREVKAEDFDPSLFDSTSTTIDNPWTPFTVGKRFVWRGWNEEEKGQRVPHRVVFTVTDMTKVINGVNAVVGWDRDYSDGRLVETELIFLAQDVSGNVWHLGQYSEIYDGRQFEGGSAWLVGQLKGAKAGIYMKANPRRRTPAYSQGYAPAPYYWDDWSKVYRVGRRTCVPRRCYRGVLVIDEYEPTKPGAHQLKYYARGVGNVRVGWRGKDPEKEVMVLTKVVRLRPAALRRARETVRDHEARAYVYGRTPAAAPR